MRSYGSRYRFVVTVLGAFSMLAGLGHAEEAKAVRRTSVRADVASPAEPAGADAALTDVGTTGTDGAIAGTGSECERIGAWQLVPPLSGSSRFRGNAYTIGNDASLVDIGMELQIASGTLANVEFAVYTRDIDTGTWVQQFSAIRPFQGTGSRSVLRSGVIDPPLALLSGVQYAIGAGWGGQTVSYNQDLAAYPQTFALGTIDGRVGRNSVSTPLPIEFLQLAINDNAYSMELCVTGACCLPNSTCIDTTQADCLAQSGEFSAAGVSCATVGSCPLTRGSCCLSGGTCAFLNEFTCGTLGGAWTADVLCDDPIEPCAPRGGCCLGDGTCLENVTRSVCATSSGTYRGDNVACAAFPPCTAGACCTGDTCILVLTQADCLAAGGSFAGPGTSCDSSPCSATGACCQGSTCSNVTTTQCISLGGTYRGDGTDCATVPIACGRGACCVPGAGCQDANGAGVTQSFCTGPLGGMFSNGASCDTIQPRCPGTCCGFGSDFCIDSVIPTECVTKAIGFFIGYATECRNGEVPPVNVCSGLNSAGSCCVGNGRCVDVDSQTTCETDLRGVYTAGTSCSANSCLPAPRGACCDRTALTCGDNVLQADCAGEWTVGTACSGLPIACVPPRGACCDGTGQNCTNGRLASECVGAGDMWTEGTLCSELPQPCAPLGACCQDNGASCSETSADRCVTAGGVYRGDTTTCLDALVCNVGACCQRDGTCQDNVLDLDCVPAAGDPAPDFFAGRPCIDVCVARGACCVGADCRITTSLECDNAGGIFSGIGSDCTANFCVDGACCTTALGNSCQQLTRQDCEGISGVYLGPTESCDQAGDCTRGSCCSASGACDEDTVQSMCGDPSDFRPGDLCVSCFGRGACCLPQGVCLVLERQACLDQGGEYSGNDTACDPTDLCRNGACCFQDATCAIDTRQGCEPAGGTYVGADTTCDVGICVGTGGCCNNGTCTPSLTATECNGTGGLFLGVGSDCADAAVCTATGACCDESSGNCINGVIEAACRSGAWSAGALCTEVACDTPGSCCDPTNRTCTDGVTETDCIASGIDTSWTAIITCRQLDPPCQFAPTGSCCNNTTGVCNDGIVEFFCSGMDETWTGGVSCRNLDPTCAAPETGACCETGACSTRTPGECAALSGNYLGANSVCGNSCDLGACCELGGNCTDDVIRVECTQVNATFTVGGVCDTALCPASGACCFTECIQTTNMDCDTQGGVFDAGECCLAAVCTVGTPEECTANMGSFGGNGTTCEVGFCDAGACCTGNSGCNDRKSRPECEVGGDVFQGVGTTCDTGVCAAGCCCSADGSFVNGALASECAAPGDRFEVGLCSNLNPLCQIRGACCLPDALDPCRLLTQADCIAFPGATYAGDATTCEADNVCEIGACCTGETCTETSRFACADGTFLGAGTMCGADTCSIGGCCQDAGGCNDLPKYECDPVGVFLGMGVVCDADKQCGTGACCNGESCTETRRFDCDGVYLGRGTTCMPGDVCAVGACCEPDDVCEELPQYECNAVGVFLGGQTLCEPGVCNACNPTIVSSDPASCLIDARYPHDPGDASTLLGWDSITLTLSCEPSGITAADFAVTVADADVAVPGIASVVQDVTTVTITFDSVIPAGHWTCVTHVDSGTMACLGSLPADVNGDGTASPGDILDLIDDLNGVSGSLGMNQCDVDRSTACGAPDILAVIDLLNGASMFQVWNGASLPACPAMP